MQKKKNIYIRKSDKNIRFSSPAYDVSGLRQKRFSVSWALIQSACGTVVS